MSKKQLLIILGAWTSLALFLGFPASWDKVIYVVTGIVVIVVALSLPSTERTMSAEKLPYVERKNLNPHVRNRSAHDLVPPSDKTPDIDMKPVMNDIVSEIKTNHP